MKKVTIKDLYRNTENYIDKTVEVAGWVRTVRDSKTFGFIELNDGSFFKNVHNVIFRLLEYKSESKFLKSIITESEIFGNNVIIDNLKQIDKEIRSYISRRLQEAIDKKYIEVDDVEITAFLIYKMYIALMFEWSDTKIDKQKMADTIIKILRDGLERKKDVKDE